jgi:hypothetical protein
VIYFTLGGKMKKLFLIGIACSIAAHAAPVPTINLYNTGQDNAHVVLPGGSVDTHYTSSGPVYVLGAPVAGSWLANDSVSEWVGPDTVNGTGTYSLVYRTTVDLTGFDPVSAVLSGRWSTDNSGDNILVNGVGTGNTAGGYSSWYTFTLTSGFIAGINTIDFAWTNSGGPGGVRVEWTSATADASVPEPASILLTLTGAAAIAFFRRRAVN